ncbi:MAG TPA: aminotransferase class V-fold PLP-dependent enzyme [Paraburkholderia sp.]|jgi:aspartate aminotransferase-like enzyme
MSCLELRLLHDTLRFPANRLVSLADRVKRLVSTAADVVFIQARPSLALEAVAQSIARRGITAVNVVTSPYGAWFGKWLRRGGVNVHDVFTEVGQPADLDAVSKRIELLPEVHIVACVHAESSNGVLNPLPQIAALAHACGALCVVDAAASIGGHRLELDSFGIDIAVMGAQKALAGPAGISAIAVSGRAWAHIEQTPGPAPSGLSLDALKRSSLGHGHDHDSLPGMPTSPEFWALEEALDRIEFEGIDAVIARHDRAARASRAGLRALGVEPSVTSDAAASTLITAAPVPEGIDVVALIAHAAHKGIELDAGFGEAVGKIVRLNHTGVRAAYDVVLSNVVAYGAALAVQRIPVDIGAAAMAVTDAYAME